MFSCSFSMFIENFTRQCLTHHCNMMNNFIAIRLFFLLSSYFAVFWQLRICIILCFTVIVSLNKMQNVYKITINVSCPFKQMCLYV